MITHLEGCLEIDHDRGVIYFHLSDKDEIFKRNLVTVLRICNLPSPIPKIQNRSLDITHMINADWDGVQKLKLKEIE